MTTIIDEISQYRLRWLGYVSRREGTEAVRVAKIVHVEGLRERRRPKKR